MRSWERVAPVLACLTPRDRALLRVLLELRYLTSGQIHRACYPGLTARSASIRLRVLRRRGVLTWLRRDAFADRRVFWGLTALGRAAAGLETAYTAGGFPAPIATTPRATAAAALQIDHLIATNEIFCDLSDARRSGRLPPCVWVAGARSAVDLDHTSLAPDGAVLIAGPDGWWAYYIERDRGTMPAAAIREKLARYALLFRMAAAQRDEALWQPRADAWLLFACDDPRRARRLAELADDAGLRDRVWAGVADECGAGLVAALRHTIAPSEAPPLPEWAAGALALPDPGCPAESGHHKEDAV